MKNPNKVITSNNNHKDATNSVEGNKGMSKKDWVTKFVHPPTDAAPTNNKN